MKRAAVDSLPEKFKTDLDKRLVQGGFSDYQGLADWLNENGFRISKSSIHRYGSKLEEKFEAIAASTQAAKSLVDNSPDDDGAVNEMVLRLVQEQLFNLMVQSEGNLEPKDLSAIARAMSDTTRASISNKKFRAEIKDKLDAKFAELEKPQKNLDAETLRIIKEQIYGLV